MTKNISICIISNTNKEKSTITLGERIKLLIPSIAAVELGTFLTVLVFPDTTLALRLAAASVYILGSIADVCSTLEAINLNLERQARGLTPVFEEANVFYPAHPTVAEFFGSRKNIIDYALAGVVVIYPPFGIGLGAGRIVAAIHNYRNCAREKAIRETEINQ